MTLSPENGTAILIDGEYRDLPAAGATMNNAPGSNETYYLYAYWTGTEVAIEATSVTIAPLYPPVKDAVYGHLVKTGDATRTYVGIARAGAAITWQDGLLVSSHYNKKEKAVTYTRSTVVTRSGGWGSIDDNMWVYLVSDEDVIFATASAAIKTDLVGNISGFQVFSGSGQDGSYMRTNNTDYTPAVSIMRALHPPGYFSIIGKHFSDGTIYTDNFEITVSKLG